MYTANNERRKQERLRDWLSHGDTPSIEPGLTM